MLAETDRGGIPLPGLYAFKPVLFSVDGARCSFSVIEDGNDIEIGRISASVIGIAESDRRTLLNDLNDEAVHPLGSQCFIG